LGVLRFAVRPVVDGRLFRRPPAAAQELGQLDRVEGLGRVKPEKQKPPPNARLAGTMRRIRRQAGLSVAQGGVVAIDPAARRLA